MGLVHIWTEEKSLGVPFPLGTSPMQMVYNGTGTQWDWYTHRLKKKILCVPVPLCTSPMEMGPFTCIFSKKTPDFSCVGSG